MTADEQRKWREEFERIPKASRTANGGEPTEIEGPGYMRATNARSSDPITSP
jgi:hypothetical protein